MLLHLQTVEEHHGNTNMQDGISLMPVILHPRSIGTVRLRSHDPHDQPIIDPQFLTANDDVKAAVSGKLLFHFKLSICFAELLLLLLPRSSFVCLSCVYLVGPSNGLLLSYVKSVCH